MGQGLYGAIGFGVLISAEQRKMLFDDDGELRVDVAERPATAYESEDEYVVYLICDTGGVTMNGYDERYAVRLDKLADDTRKRYREAYARAESKWATFAQAAGKLGVELPVGELIYIHDYD